MKSICPFVWEGKFCVSLLNVKWRKVNFYSTWSVQLSNFSLPSPCAKCVHLRSSFHSVCADNVHKAPTDVRSSCVHKAFILHSPFVQCSFIVQSDNTIFRLITIHICSLFFLITEETQSKDNRLYRSSCVHISFTYCSPCVYRSLCARVCALFAFCVRTPFISAHQISFSVRSPFTRRSRWKVERFRDCD